MEMATTTINQMSNISMHVLTPLEIITKKNLSRLPWKEALENHAGCNSSIEILVQRLQKFREIPHFLQ